MEEYTNTSTGRNGTIQEYEVLVTGTYRIIAYGAQGGTGSQSGIGGLGARISGVFSLSQGSILKIIVGHQGSGDGYLASGGGASAIWIDGDTEPLIVAGAGGGYGVGSTTTNQEVAHASLTTDGKNAFGGSSAGAGGTGGNGGAGASTRGAGGGGWLSAGGNGTNAGSGGFILFNDGTGGNGLSSSIGGFGSGGGVDQSTSWGACGGGGGYSGGGGAYASSAIAEAAGGGGGSYNSGENQEATVENEGHGYVTIELLGAEEEIVLTEHYAVVETETETLNILSSDDLISMDINMSLSDTVPHALINIANKDGKYNDSIDIGNNVKIFSVYNNQNFIYDLESDVFSYYNCNDSINTSVLTDSVGFNNGTNTDITYVSDAVYGEAIYFDGDSSKVVLPNFDVDASDSFSINLWFKPDSTERYDLFSATGSGMAAAALRRHNDITGDELHATFFHTEYTAMSALDVAENQDVYIAGYNIDDGKYHLLKVVKDSNGDYQEEWRNTNHTNIINRVRFRNGYVYTASDDNTVRKFNADTGNQEWSFTGHTNNVIALSVDINDNVYSGSEDNTFRKILPNGTQDWSNNLSAHVRGVVVDYNNDILSITADSKVRKHSSGNTLIWLNDDQDHTWFQGYDIDVDNDGLIFCTFWNEIAKISPSGVWLDDTFWLNAGTLYRIVCNNNNNFFLCSETFNSYAKYDYDFNQIWTQAEMGINDIRVDKLGGIQEKTTQILNISDKLRISHNSNTIIFDINDISYDYELDKVLFDRFHMLTFTYKNGKCMGYLDSYPILRINDNLEGTDLDFILGEELIDTYDYYKGVMDEIIVWKDKALDNSEVEFLYNSSYGLTFDKFKKENLLFYGKVEIPNYNYDTSTGFTITLDAKSFPQLVDSFFTDIFVAETGYSAIDKILEHYRKHENVRFAFWNGYCWVSTKYNNETGISEWTSIVDNFPDTTEDLINAVYQDSNGWSSIRDICSKLGLDVFLDYDYVNDVWYVKAFNSNEYKHKNTKELHQWRMNDLVTNINYDTSIVFDIKRKTLDESLNNSTAYMNFNSLPIQVKDYITGFRGNIYTGYLGSVSALSHNSNIPLYIFQGAASFIMDMIINKDGYLYVAGLSSLTKYNLNNAPFGAGAYMLESDFNISTSNISIDVTDYDIGGFIVSGHSDGSVRIRNTINGEIIKEQLDVHTDEIHAIKIDNYGYIYTGSNDNTVKKLNKDLEVEWTFTGFSNNILDIAVDKYNYIYIIDEAFTIKKLTMSGHELWSTSYAGAGYSITVDNDGNVIAGGASSRIVKLTSGGTEIWNNTYSGDHITALDTDFDNNIYACGWINRTIKILPNGTQDWVAIYGDTSSGRAISVDKRRLRNVISKDFLYDNIIYDMSISYVNRSSDSLGEIFVNIPRIRANSDNKYILETENDGINDSKNIRTWSDNTILVLTFDEPNTEDVWGEMEYVIPGTYEWICPPDVTSVSVVAVGGGGGPAGHTSGASGAGGGGLGWKNNISVTPGNSYTVVVGAGGTRVTSGTAPSGGNSYFIDTSTVCGFGGQGGVAASNANRTGGGFVGDGGGNGGNGGNRNSSTTGGAGGGGAGGYSGNGGVGAPANSVTAGGTGSGGAGGGGGRGGSVRTAGSGGGVGLYGLGPSGVGGAGSSNDGATGFSGSGGKQGNEVSTSALGSVYSASNLSTPGLYGGGGSGADTASNTQANGAGGAVRIMWGSGREFPDVNTQPVGSIIPFLDNSQYNNHGVNDGTSYIFSNNSDCRVFSGASKIDVDDIDRPEEHITIDAWIYKIGEEEGVIVGADDGSGNDRSFVFGVNSDNRLFFEKYTDSTLSTTVCIPTIPLEEWTYVAMSYDRASVKFYINGEMVSQSITFGKIDSGTGMAIGASSNTNGTRGFNGYMSFVRIINGDVKDAFIDSFYKGYIGRLYSIHSNDLLSDMFDYKHGVFDNKFVSSENAVIGKGLKSGEDDVDNKIFVPTDSASELNFSPMTISTWVKPLEIKDAPILSRGSWEFQIDDDDKFSFIINKDDSTTVKLQSDVVAEENKWYNLAVVYDTNVPALLGDGYNLPGTVIDEDPGLFDAINWSNKDNIKTKDTNFASQTAGGVIIGTAITRHMIANNLGFSVPPGTEIEGIEIRFEASKQHSDGVIYIDTAFFDDDTSPITTPVRTYLDTNWVEYVIGGPTDTFGIDPLNDTVVNNSDFGVGFIAGESGGSDLNSARVRWVEVKVFYHSDTTGVVKFFVNNELQVEESLFNDSIDSSILPFHGLRWGNNDVGTSWHNSGYVTTHTNINAVFDDTRIYDEALSNEDISNLYSNGMGTENVLIDTDVDVIQGVNMVSVTDSSLDNADVYNRIKVYSEAEGENIMYLHTENNLSSQSSTWVKDSVIVDNSLTNSNEVRSRAFSEILKKSNPLKKASVSSVGVPKKFLGKNVTLNIPNCKLSGLFNVKSIIYNIDTEFILDIELAKKTESFRDIFISKLNVDDFVNPNNNFNGMEYALTVNFTETPPKVIFDDDIEIIDGDIMLTSGTTNGVVTSRIQTVGKQITQCEFRRLENFATQNDEYYVTNNGGITWEQIETTMGPHNFQQPGNLIGFRMVLNRDAPNNPSPMYRAVSLMYK